MQVNNHTRKTLKNKQRRDTLHCVTVFYIHYFFNI